MNGSVFKTCPCNRDGQKTTKNCSKDHGSWHFIHDLPSLTDGARPRITRGGYSTRKAAEQALVDALADTRQRGVAAERDLVGRRQLLAVYLPQWLAGRPDSSRRPGSSTRHRSSST